MTKEKFLELQEKVSVLCVTMALSYGLQTDLGIGRENILLDLFTKSLR